MSNIFEDALKGLFGSDSDAAAEAGKDYVARATQAIEIMDRNVQTARDALQAGTTSAISTIDRSLAEAEANLRAGGASSIELLDQGRARAANQIDRSAQLQYDQLKKGYDIGVNAINTGAAQSTSFIQGGLTRALDAVRSASNGSMAAFNTALDNVREDLNPFIEGGKRGFARAEELTNDPNAQREFIENNPFFDSLADDAERRTLNNRAARGKVGSGGTKASLQNQLVLMGADLVNQSINQNFGIADRGLGAAIELGRSEEGIAGLIASTLQNEGAQVAGLETGAAGDLAGIATRQGESLTGLAQTGSINAANIEQGRGDSFSRLERDVSRDKVNTVDNYTNQLVNLVVAGGQTTGNIQLDNALRQAGLVERSGVNNANLLIGIGSAEAGATLGEREGEVSGLNRLIEAGVAIGTGGKSLLLPKEEDKSTRNSVGGGSFRFG